MTTLLIGYAIGTIQVLLLAWFTHRAKHRGDLRVLRAELRRAASFAEKFDIDDATRTDDFMPRPPTVSPRFADFVTQTEFYLTDEHDDDNSQQALLGILDGCSGLDHYVGEIRVCLEARRTETDLVRKLDLGDRMKELAREYDVQLETFQFAVNDALRDIGRRLDDARTWRQLNRPMGRLPKGTNPLVLTKNDPRLPRRGGSSA